MKTKRDQWAEEYRQAFEDHYGGSIQADLGAWRAGFEKCREEMLKRAKYLYVVSEDIESLGLEPAEEDLATNED